MILRHSLKIAFTCLIAFTTCIASDSDMVRPEDFEKKPSYKIAKPTLAIEIEPLRTAFWWALASYEEPLEENPVTGAPEEKPIEFPMLSPIATLTFYTGSGGSLSATYLLDFELKGGWGAGGGFGIHEVDKKLRGFYWGGKGYYLNLAEYGHSFRAYGELGNRFLLQNKVCASIGAALGFGNNGINTRDGATMGLMVELQARIGTWF